MSVLEEIHTTDIESIFNDTYMDSNGFISDSLQPEDMIIEDRNILLSTDNTIILPYIPEETKYSHFNFDTFPTELLDLENDLSICQPSSDSQTLPVIVINKYEEEEPCSDSNESGYHSVASNTGGEEKEEEAGSNYSTVPVLARTRLKRRYSSSSSSSYVSDDDGEWKPSPKRTKRRTAISRLSESSSDGDELMTYKSNAQSKRPTPQRRSPGTSCKMVQWIVSLLRDRAYNPRVITWLDEPNGVFTIKDTVEYARLWGQKKGNNKMNYEKLSRGMRYYYSNGELQPIVDQRLTYKFGPTARDFRAMDPTNPNFTRKL